MSLLSQVKRGKVKPPVLLLVQGPAGVGKSTLASGAPDPIFMGAENGTLFLDVARFPAPKKFDDILTGIQELTTEKHDYKSLVIDSLDWVEPLVWAKVCEEEHVESIEKIGFQKGYIFALKYWQEMISTLSRLREVRGMHVILIAHSQIKKFDDPKTNSAYDRYVMKLHEKASALWREYVDTMGFATFEVHTAKDKSGKERAYGEGKRVLHTEYRPAWDAKNRMGLPPEIDLSWDAFMESYDKGCPENPEIMKANIDQMLPLAPEEVRPKVKDALVRAGNDPAKLAVIQNRLRTLTSAA